MYLRFIGLMGQSLTYTPSQTNQHIASYLDSDAFLCNFRRISHSTHNAVDGDRLSFWRRRFLARFEKPTWTEPSNLKYKHAYQKRRKALMYGAKFDAAVRRTESKEIKKANAALEVVRDILVGKLSLLTRRTSPSVHQLTPRRFILGKEGGRRQALRLDQPRARSPIHHQP